MGIVNSIFIKVFSIFFYFYLPRKLEVKTKNINSTFSNKIYAKITKNRCCVYINMIKKIGKRNGIAYSYNIR